MPRTKKNTNNTESSTVPEPEEAPAQTQETQPEQESHNETEIEQTQTQPAKKRGRKPKQKENTTNDTTSTSTDTQNVIVQTDNNHTNEENETECDDTMPQEKDKVIKKRGRKPKGGKIIQQPTSKNSMTEAKTNVILHLKCSIKDLHNNLFGTNIESFNFSSKSTIGSNCETLGSTNLETAINNMNNANLYNNVSSMSTSSMQTQNIDDHEDLCTNSKIHNDYDCETKDIWKKLKQLQHNLHMNNISDKRSACFWCTYDFDNPPVYIPKHDIKDSYHVYGCFCSPECAAAYLMEENIDSSSKFERYYLLNHIYSKIYNYTKEIKPSPNPYYMLDKYYGNLTIQEYRALLRNDRLFLIVDKPLTRILPELHEDNDDFIINNKIIPSNTYQVKKNVQKKTSSKSDIIHEKFGF